LLPGACVPHAGVSSPTFVGLESGWSVVPCGTASREPASMTEQKPALDSAGQPGPVESALPSSTSSLLGVIWGTWLTAAAVRSRSSRTKEYLVLSRGRDGFAQSFACTVRRFCIPMINCRSANPRSAHEMFYQFSRPFERGAVRFLCSLALSRLARLEPCSCWRRPVSSELPLRRLSTPQRSLSRSPVAGLPATKTLASDRPFARPLRPVFYADRCEVTVPGLAFPRTVSLLPPPALP
jgi:hypothetical protein